MFMHYQEHIEHDGPIAFSKFVHIHYTTDHPHQDNDMDTEQMPFQDHHSSYSVIAPIKDFYASTIKIEIGSDQTTKIRIHPEDFPPSSFIDQIWQPPRSC